MGQSGWGRFDRITDERLVAAYLELGDQEALEVLLRRHHDRVRRLVYPMLLNHADTDDVVQEIFVRVVQGLSRSAGRLPSRPGCVEW